MAAARRLPGRGPEADPRLATRVAELDLSNLIGLAAGFDKEAVMGRGNGAGQARAMASMADWLTLDISSLDTPGLHGLQ